MNGPPRLAFAAIWHQLPFEDLLALVRCAERLGYEAAYLDGDVTTVPSLGDTDVLDGWTVQTALTLRTERIRLASIRLVHHWSALRLAQATATLERIAPGRQRLFLAVGAHSADARSGLPFPSHADRVEWLDETIDAVRQLWTGAPVTLAGTHVQLNGASVRPALPEPPVIEIGAAARFTLEVVARRADAWNLNLPPIEAAVAQATQTVAEACARHGRSPLEIERSLWLFARPERAPDDPGTLAEYRRFAPWFGDFPDARLTEGFLVGGETAARTRLEGLRKRLALDLPVVDVTGLELDEACRALESLGPRHGRAPAAS